MAVPFLKKGTRTWVDSLVQHPPDFSARLLVEPVSRGTNHILNVLRQFPWQLHFAEDQVLIYQLIVQASFPATR